MLCAPCALRSEPIDIGHGVSLMWDDDGRGFHWRHPGCRAWMPLRLKPDEKSAGHSLLSGGRGDMAALTIHGSLRCPACGGSHGFIRGGRWVPE